MRASIQQCIREFVIDNFLFGDGGDLGDGDSLLEAGILDSTGVLELVGFLEATFDVTVQDHEMVPANLDSVERAARFVSGKLNERDSTLAG